MIRNTTKGAEIKMNNMFAESIRRLRREKGLSQQQLAEKLYVDRSTLASWETGRRVPDASLITRISEQLGVDVNNLLNTSANADEPLQVIMLDDEKIILTGGLPLLKEAIPNARINAFEKPSEALEFARHNRIFLALVDIELGKISGLDVCRELLKINPRTNVIFLTAYMEYSYDAWDTGACGFVLKPLSSVAVQKQLSLLRYPHLSI